MDAHPVPQNVTNFEFHLVGDMTLKQFVYLASGLATGYLMFVFFASDYPVVAWPIIVIAVILGVAFAFLPIQDRPLDHWVVAFFKAVFRPTKRVYASATLPADSPVFVNRLPSFIQSTLHPGQTPQPAMQVVQSGPTGEPVVKKSGPTQLNKDLIKQIINNPNAELPEEEIKEQIQPIHPETTPLPPTPAPQAQPLPPPPTAENLPSREELAQTVDLARKAQLVQTQILETEKELNEIKTKAALPNNDPASYTQQFQAVLSKLQELNKQASEISRQMALLAKIPSQNISSDNAMKAKSVENMSLTAIPNIVNGIVTDTMGNYVEGAIIVAHDKQGLPVRALKSNKLGQFIAATPLSNSSYTLSIEKDDLIFDPIEITLNGEIIKPIAVMAKKAGRVVI